MADRTDPTTSGPPQRRGPLPSLTGLRFLAALLVFMTHSSMSINPLRPTEPVSFFSDHGIVTSMSDFFQPAGPIGVSFFFVLSGFVLTWSLTAGERPAALWRRRVLKIYPNHIVTWALAMWLFASSTPVHAYVSNLLLLHAFSNRPDTVQSVNFPSWSLCSEMLFYALFPLFIVAVRRIAVSRLWLWAGVMVAGVGAVTVVTTQVVHGGLKVPMYSLSVNQQWFGYAFPPPRLFEFVLGMILARIVAAGLWPRIGLLPSSLLFAGAYWGALAAPDPYDFSLITIIPVGMIICAAATRDTRGASGWAGSPAMVWLGNVSFAFYLLQAPIIFYGRNRVLHSHTYGIAPAIALLAAMLVVNLLAAWALFSLVERPVMRRWARSRKRPGQQPPAPRSAQQVPAGGTV